MEKEGWAKLLQVFRFSKVVPEASEIVSYKKDSEDETQNFHQRCLDPVVQVVVLDAMEEGLDPQDFEKNY